jgi:hypothetical protein
MTDPFFLAKGKALVFEYGMDFVHTLRVIDKKEMEDASE